MYAFDRFRRGVAVLVTVAAVGTAPGCGSEESTPQRSATAHNSADVDFATAMIPHHAQALTLVDLSRGRPLDPEVEQLAEEILAEQAPEIEQMVDWLDEWGEEVPATMRDHEHAGHDGAEGSGGLEMPSSDMPGMLDVEQVAELEDAPDAMFQELWLQRMLAHHQGAVQMAQTEQEQGLFGPELDLAAEVESGQSDQIDRIEALLG